METRTRHRGRALLGDANPRLTVRKVIGWLLFGVAYVSALSFYKTILRDQLAREGIQALRALHPQVLSLFHGSFYSFSDRDIGPKIEQLLSGTANIRRLRLLAPDGKVVFDTGKGSNPVSQEIVSSLPKRGLSVHFLGPSVQILIASEKIGVLYSLDDRGILIRLIIGVALGLVLVIGLIRSDISLSERLRSSWRRFWMLRAKFISTIVLINLITVGIVFASLISLQTREQTRRIERQSTIFAQFATDRIISSFVQFFDKSYVERFIPEAKNVIASNEDLIKFRIISVRTRHVLFDTEEALSESGDSQLAEVQQATFPLEVEEQFRARDLATRSYVQDGEKVFSVINTYRTANQDAVFLVEYLFNYDSLDRSLRLLREQILLDLIPAVAVGLLIALLFAQLLISPIKKLVVALRRVSSGDFTTNVPVTSRDEIGAVGDAFNAMTDELRRKKELRKYLSNTSYSRIMRAMESREGMKVGGVRVSATILFSDIRDFVAHCESLEAEEVTSMLNEYFSEMVEVVDKNGGEVDKFIGDAILAVFYAEETYKVIRPTVDADLSSSNSSALQAIYCALEMRARLAEFNARRLAQGKGTIEIGVGISHGDIISGPIGSENRMDFTVIGDVVNLANRIEKLSKKGRHTHIVFSHHVEEKIRGLLDYVEIAVEGIRGKQEEVRVYELVAIKDLASLVRNLEAPDQILRRRSVELLGQSGNPDAIHALMGVLDDRDDEVRIGAGLALAKLSPHVAGKTVEDALFVQLKKESSSKVLSALISAIGRVCRDERVLDLEPFLHSDNERIVANAIEALGQVRSPRCTDLILPKLNSRNNRIKANAAMAIFAAGHIEVIDTLKPMLMHSDPLMRSSAAFAIGELTAIADVSVLLKGFREDSTRVKLFLAELQECVPMLVALLKDPEPMVKRQAVIALGKIKDKSAVLPMIQMIDLRSAGEAITTMGSAELAKDILEAVRAIGSHRLVREVIARLSL